MRIRVIFSGLLLVGGLSGCTKLGPDFMPLDLQPTPKWQLQNTQRFQVGDNRTWWKAFNDPTLNRLIDSAYAQNVDLQVVALRILEARALLGVARGNLFPQKQEVGSALLHNQLSETSPNIDRFKFWSFDAGFDALWEIDIWGKFRRAVEAADAKLVAASADYDAALVSLTAEVAATYTKLRTDQERLVLAKRNASLQQRILHITEVRYRDGLSSELDLQQARSLYFSTRGLIATLELGLRQSFNALSTLLGSHPAEFKLDLEASNGIPRVASAINLSMPAEMLRRRPDIRREEAIAASESAMVGVTEAELYPQFSLRGSIGLASSSAGQANLFNIFGPATLTSVAGPQVTWPILNYGRLRNNVRAQDARLQQALTSYRGTVLRALREVEDGMIGYVKSQELADNLLQSVEAADKAVKLSLLQYEHGLEDFTSVLNSQQMLVQQQDRLLSSQGEASRHLIAMYKALGGGWEIRLGREFLPKTTKIEMKQRTAWSDLL